MPYKVIKQGDKFAVHKMDENDKPMGKALGMHKTRAEAMAQMKALYASESKKKEIEPDNLDGSTETKELEKCMDEISYTPSFGPTTWEELEAAETAFETAEHMNDMTWKFREMANAIINNPMIEDKAQALVDVANGYAERVKKPSQEMEEKSLEEISKQIAGDNQPVKEVISESKKENELVIWKENGQYRWLVAYSNNQRDRETEIITSESHKEFDLALSKKEWPLPQLWLWHIPYPVGQTDYHAYDESTGYPVAAGHFYKEMDWAAEGLLKAGWEGSSHGMPDRWIQRDKEDSSLIVRHRTKEISFLPQRAAANKNTFSIISKEQNMDIEKGLPAHKRPEFVAAFGEERVKQIEETLASKAKEADEQGIEKKEVKEPTMADVVKALEFLTTELITLKKEFSESKPVEKEVEEFDLVTRLKSLSAVGQETTKVDGRTALAKSGPEEAKQEAKADPITGLSVPLVDKIFASNQQWYNGGAK